MGQSPAYTFVTTTAIAACTLFSPSTFNNTSQLNSTSSTYELNVAMQPVYRKTDSDHSTTEDILERTHGETQTSNIRSQVSVNITVNDMEYYDRWFNMILQYYKQHKQMQSSFSDLSYLKVFSVVSNLTKELAQLGFEKSKLEMVDNDSINISMKFDQNRSLMITKSLEAEDLDNNNIVISLFQNKKRIVSDVFEIETFVEGFKKYLSV